MRLLRLITWPYVRRHKLRTVLTTLGIVLGVSVFIGMHTANQSVLYAFYKTVDRIAGKAELQITAGEGGFPEAVLERVQALPEVKVAVPVIEAPVDTGLKGEGNLLILAVDMTGDRSLRDYDLESGEDAVIDDPLVFLAQPDSLMVTREFAERNGLSIGTKVPMRTMDGEKQFTVRGIMKSGGLTQAFGGNLAVMDIYAAQMVFGRGRTFDRVDLALTPGVTIQQGRTAIEKALGPGYQVEPPASRGQQIDSVIRVYAFTANINSAFALFIGMFIIYNSFSIAVAQRRREIGILRALGVRSRQILVLFLARAAFIGLLGAALGFAAGWLGSWAWDARTASGAITGEDARATLGALFDPALLGLVLVLTPLFSALVSWIPALLAAQQDPADALREA